MNRQRRWVILIVALILNIFLMLTFVVPGWGTPAQNVERQTVPELMPRAYLPFVLQRASGLTSGVYLPVVLRNYSVTFSDNLRCYLSLIS